MVNHSQIFSKWALLAALLIGSITLAVAQKHINAGNAQVPHPLRALFADRVGATVHAPER